MKSRVTPYSFWAVTSLRTAPLRFHSPYSAISDLSPSSPMRTPLKILRTHLGILRPCPLALIVAAALAASAALVSIVPTEHLRSLASSEASSSRPTLADRSPPLDRRPYRPGKRNYVPIMIVALAASLVLGRHLLTLIAALLSIACR